MYDQSGRFRLEITSLEDFIAFVAVIRGEELDADKLNALSAKLKASRKELSSAIAADAPVNPLQKEN